MQFYEYSILPVCVWDGFECEIKATVLLSLTVVFNEEKWSGKRQKEKSKYGNSAEWLI